MAPNQLVISRAIMESLQVAVRQQRFSSQRKQNVGQIPEDRVGNISVSQGYFVGLPDANYKMKFSWLFLKKDRKKSTRSTVAHTEGAEQLFSGFQQMVWDSGLLI